MVMNNLSAFNTAITSPRALFQVDCVLAPPDVIMHPAVNEVFKLTFQCVRDCSETYASCSPRTVLLLCIGSIVNSEQ